MIKLFNDSLNTRYQTPERNIKSKSNSFYDSYLDLLEATIKYFLDENNISYDDTRTCGHIVKTEEAKSFFLNTLKLDDYNYNKLPDILRNVMTISIRKEKTVTVEGFINYLKGYYDLINYYLDYIKAVCAKVSCCVQMYQYLSYLPLNIEL